MTSEKPFALSEVAQRVFPYRRLISLTELGKEVAKRVIEIEELIKKVRTND